MARMRVLLVDDEEELVSTLEERLALRDIDVEYVLSGDQALNRIKEKDYDIVLLDVMMPGMNGMDVLVNIRRLRPETQIILLTGLSDAKDCENSLKHGAFDYIVKPVRIDTLIQKMHEAMRCGK